MMLLTLCCFLQSGNSQPEIPPALAAMLQSRASPSTALVEWSYDDARRPYRGPVYQTSRFAGEDQIYIERGDSDGVFNRQADGSIPPQPDGLPRVMYHDGKAWVNEIEGLSVNLYEIGDEMSSLRDPRSFGLLPFAAQRVKPEDVLDNAFGGGDDDQPRRISAFEAREEDGIHKVRAYSEEVPYAIEWWIDSEKDWSPVRTRWVDLEGEVISESQTVLENVDDRWFPKAVLYFRKNYEDGTVPVETIEVQHAEFDKESHPKRFVPEDIGVEFGTNLQPKTKNPGGWASDGELVFWDGDKLISKQEYGELRKAGRPQGPAWQAYKDRLASGSTVEGRASVFGDFTPAHVKRRTSDAWDTYTRDFISRYSLDEPQTKKAWEICTSAKKNRDEYLDRHEKDFNETAQEYDKIKRLNETESKDRREKLEAHWRKLTVPIDRRFIALKEELNRLPTEAQRKAAREKERESFTSKSK